jgi:Integrase core domain
MGTCGDAYDDALAESFFATFETELLDRELFLTRIAARMAAFDFIEAWCNPWLRQSSLGQISPAEFERSVARRASERGGDGLNYDRWPELRSPTVDPSTKAGQLHRA